MKYSAIRLSIFFMCFTLQNVSGQITQSNFFSLGISYPNEFLDNINLDTANLSGNNIIWDFSTAIKTNDLDTLHGINPSTTIFYNDPNANYTISNLCLSEPKCNPWPQDDKMFSYYISSPDRIKFVGSWADNGIWEIWYQHYTDTASLLKFPMAFNDFLSDSLMGSSFDMSGFGWVTTIGSINSVLDGFGTLIVPGKIYTNCLRVKVKIIIQDSWSWGGQQRTDFEYYWFQKNINGPILILKGGNTNIFSAKHFYNNPFTTSVNNVSNKDNILIYPNPSSGLFTFSNIGINSSIEIYDITGRLIFNTTTQNTSETINLYDKQKGVYFYKIISDKKEMEQGKLIIQ